MHITLFLHFCRCFCIMIHNDFCILFFLQYLKNILFQYMTGKETKVNLLSIISLFPYVTLVSCWVSSGFLICHLVCLSLQWYFNSGKIEQVPQLHQNICWCINTVSLLLYTCVCGMTLWYDCVRVSLLFCFQTLSRVIATIVHFSDEQTKRIISYEDAKNSVCTEDRVCTSRTPSVH